MGPILGLYMWMTAWMVPILDHSCRQQASDSAYFETIHVDDSLDGAYFGTIHVDDSLDGAYLGLFM